MVNIDLMHDEIKVTSDVTNDVLFDDDARDPLFNGIKIAAEAVCCTLGPKGKCVLIQGTNDVPIITKDGVSVSKAIRLKDPVERMGANLVREAASKTNDIAGDGTTTATALTFALVSESRKLTTSGLDPRLIREGMTHAVERVIDYVRSNVTKLSTRDEIVNVGTISANGDKTIGEIVADAFNSVGADGVITVEDAKSMHTVLDIVEGMQFERGYLSPYFANNSERMHALYNDAHVLVTDKKISTLQDIVPVLEHIHKAGKALLIIADDIEGEALQALVLNRVKANLNVVAIKAPGYGQLRDAMLGDICALTGAKLISSSTGTKLQDASTMLGTCKKVIVDQKNTLLVGLSSAKEAVLARVQELKAQLEDPSLEVERIVHLKQRIAKLSGGVAIVKVGGVTEMEMIERKYRIEDALNATRAAIEEGIVIGGGCALLKAKNALEGKCNLDLDKSYILGYEAVMRACAEPLRRIVKNSGKSPEVVFEKLSTGVSASTGYDASLDVVCDMFKSGIIDPFKVTRTALENALSVALLFTSLGAVVSNYEEQKAL